MTIFFYHHKMKRQLGAGVGILLDTRSRTRRGIKLGEIVNPNLNG